MADLMSEDEMKKWPGYTGERHPDTWNINAKPPQPTEKKPGQLTEQQVNEYFENGVVLVENYFTAEELNPVKPAIAGLVDKLANLLYDNGKITEKFEELDFFKRLTAINNAFPGANVILHKMGDLPEEVRKLWSCDKFMNAMEQLIGPDIGGNPVWNLRPKTPQDESTTVPWHQDCAYFDRDSYKTHIATAWIPLLDATQETGCMQFAVQGHKSGKIGLHQCCDGSTHYVMMQPEVMSQQLNVDIEKDLKVMPCMYGSVLFFNNCIPHRSLNNMSNVVRWSLDLRWQNPNKPWGFHGLVDGIPFRKSDNKNYRPTNAMFEEMLETPFDSVFNQHDTNTEEGRKAYLTDTTITGPYMKNWEIVNRNNHTINLNF